MPNPQAKLPSSPCSPGYGNGIRIHFVSANQIFIQKNKKMEQILITPAIAEKVLYTGKTHTTGGREGKSTSSDGRLDILLSTPGTAGKGTNPEQLFAAGWSACFIGALKIAAQQKKVVLPADLSVDAEIDLGTNENGFLLKARLFIHLPGIDESVAKSLIETAHQTCPYSKATRDNIDVSLNLV